MASTGGDQRPETRLALRFFTVLAIASALFGLLWAFGFFGFWGFLAGVTTVAGLSGWMVQAFRQDLQSARREAAARLRTRLAKSLKGPLRAHIVEGVNDPLLLVSPERTVLVANQAARDLFGRQIQGRAVSLHLRDPAALEAIDEAIELGVPVRTEVAFSSPSEAVYAVSVARVENLKEGQSRVFGTDEPPFYIVITFHDVTHAKIAEKMRVDFVANASHELRTPLSSLIGFIETLETMGNDDAEARARFLSIMHSEADRMVRLIDDLLSLSRIEMDRHVQPRGEVDIATLADDVIKSQAHDAAQRSMSLETDIEQDIPPVRGDRDQLFQVLQNLVRNAIKYAHEGTAVTISAGRSPARSDDGPADVLVAVKDRGEGIPEDHIPRLTERFYRVDTARSRRMGGTGLGLAIVKHIVSRHRGDLSIESKLGEGTTVSMKLPGVERGSEPDAGATKGDSDKAQQKDAAGLLPESRS